jgi:anti-sigma regulatory factor (Ser/Thr protein kinase)
MGAILSPHSLLEQQRHFALAHTSDIASVRRHARQLSDRLAFSEIQAGQLAIVVTEVATNVLKHAGHGTLILTPVQRQGRAAIEVLALDQGPGLANLSQSLRDGISTAGTAGNGLGAIKRMSQEFDAYSAAGKGAAFFACVHGELASFAPDAADTGPARHLQYGAICVPVAGEEECGDAWAVQAGRDSVSMVVADGLGHGPDAAIASYAAVRAFEASPGMAPAPLLEKMHQAMRATRGAAVAVGRLDLVSNVIRFAGIGNISAIVIDHGARRQLVSHNGIVGNNMRKVQEFEQPWPEDGLGLYIMCSDGIATQWDLQNYPGLQYSHPSLIAGVLFRDFARGRDDATVLVVKHGRGGQAA